MARPSATAALASAALSLAACSRDEAGARAPVVLLTTTSIRDTGLLEALLPPFEAETGFAVRPIVAGSGDALAQGARGEGDLVLAHAPLAERAFMTAGNGEDRALVMWNEFVVVGPHVDPAAARGKDAASAFARIAGAGARFVSRGDESGTHAKERELWARAGVDPKGRPFHVESGQGQALTLELASEAGAYALTDRGTFLVHRRRLALEVLVDGDPALKNAYHAMRVRKEKFPKVNAEGAEALSRFLRSPEGQAKIGQHGAERVGEPLFFPAAGQMEEALARPGELRAGSGEPGSL